MQNALKYDMSEWEKEQPCINKCSCPILGSCEAAKILYSLSDVFENVSDVQTSITQDFPVAGQPFISSMVSYKRGRFVCLFECSVSLTVSAGITQLH